MYVFLWLDCEFTGLDVNRDEIIEIAIIPTDNKLRKLDDGIDLVIKPTGNSVNNMGSYVRKMHESSGLLNALDSGVSLKEAEQMALSYTKRFVKKHKAFLAGNSIWSDKKFLEKYMPTFLNYLHYRLLDVSSIKILVNAWFPERFKEMPRKKSRHRALDDVKESIRELEYYRETVFK